MIRNRPVRYCRCGTRLARDNSDMICGPCRQKARDETLRPPQVPAEFWETEQMRDALASWHMGRICFAYRHNPFHGVRPLSQELVAGWLGLTQPRLSRIENGPPIHDLEQLIHWARTLRIPPDRLWFDLPEERRKNKLDPSSQPEPSVVEAGPVEDPAMIRPGSTRLVAVLNGSKALDGELLAELEARVNMYRRMDRRLGAPVIVADLMAHLECLSALKGLPAMPDTRNRLACHAAGVAALLGWQTLDMGQLDRAWGYYRCAARAARESGDVELHAYVIAEMSYIPLLNGCVREASSLVAHAEQLCARPVSSTFRAWLAGVSAEISSWAEDEVRCLKALERAAVLLGSAVPGESPIPALSHFDLSHLARWNGQCLAQLGRGPQAQTILEEAMTTVDVSFVRARAGMTLDLAVSYLRQGGLEPACHMVRQALMLARQTQSVRYQRRVIVFRSQLEPWADSRAVQQLDQELQYLA